MDIKISFLDKNNNLIKTINPKEDELINKRFKRKKSILDIALDNNIDLKYGCMGGSCSACKCEIINGGEFLDLEGVRKLVFKGMNENEILTCLVTLKDLKENQKVEITIKLLL